MIFLKIISHGVQRLISAIPTTLSPPADNEVKQQPYQDQLEALKLLINNGYPNTALSQLIELEKELNDKELTNSIRARVNTLIGICYVELENNKDAIDRFNRAYYLNPDAEETQANLAIVYLMNNELEKCIELCEQLLHKQSAGTNARAILFDARARLRNYENLDELVDEKYLDDKNYTRVVGFSFAFSSDLLNAERYLRLGWAQSPGDYYLGLTLARVLMKKSIPMNGAFSSGFENNETLIEATKEPVKMVNQVLKKVSKGDNQDKILNTLASRAGLYISQGNVVEAKKDCDRVLEDDQKNLLAIHNRGIVSLIENDFSFAISYLEQLPDDYIAEENLSFALARAYIGIKKYDNAISILEKHPSKNITHSIENTVMKTWALILKSKIEEAKDLQQELINLAPENYYCIEAVGRCSFDVRTIERCSIEF